ncbi:restriction endonuclease subunit S [Xenorhabdus sp. M]|uniref:Restriction endonuclease subunit S n=1 Tax=Xenorhabdus szentirmaii TaxID=290112 RepID=A0AAW3Z1L0_9GAMM|nr:restriction endonuclease subunit S [Xenorhabdus sp. M]MBD2802944.1 restriction endonuclease subunit S [Xenorhabdus sp. M]
MILMKRTPLSQLASVSAGQGAPKDNEFSGSGVPFVRAGSLKALLSGKSESELELVSPEMAKLRKLKIYPKGTILFAKSGMSVTKDRVYVLQNPAHVVSHLATLIPKDCVYVDYLRLALKHFPPSSLIKDLSYPAIGLGDIENFEIPVPEEFDNQIRISHLLGKVEGLIVQRKQHLQQLDDLLKSVFLEIFGDPVTNENGWDKPEFLAIISSMRNGLSPSKAGAYKGRVYTLSAITGDSFREIHKEDIFSQIHQKYYPTPNDFLLCRGNGNLSLVGKGYFFPSVSTDVIFPDTIIAVSIQPDTINRAFFEALWKTKFIRQQIENSARTTNGAHKVNQGVIENIKIIRPPMDLQNQFAAIVKKVESIRSLYQQSLTDLECLYGALSQQAFNGELDLSQVSMPKLPTEDAITVSQGEQATMPAPVVQTVPAIHLPDNDSLLPALENAEARKTLIEEWLEAYRTQLADTPFLLQQFMELAQSRLAEIHPDNDFVLGTSDFEHIKAWVFEALATGKLSQVFDDAGNCIELKAAIEQSLT